MRRSLEAELDRSRLELRQLQEHTRSLDLDNKASFEAEKLLAALGSSIDQVMQREGVLGAATSLVPAVGPLLSSPLSSSLVSEDDTSSPCSFPQQSLSERVDEVLGRLQSLRSWAREEQRTKKILEQQCATLNQVPQFLDRSHVSLKRPLLSPPSSLSSQDLTTSQLGLSDVHQQLKKVQHSVVEKEREAKEKASEMEMQSQQIQSLKEDLERCRKELLEMSDQFEACKGKLQHQTLALQRKEGDFSCLSMELDAKGSLITKLQEQLSRYPDLTCLSRDANLYLPCVSTKKELEEANAESTHKHEQLKAAKAHNDRIMSTIHQIGLR